MAEEEKPYWFYAKWYGWGWGLPATWQGWLVVAVWIGLIFAAVQFAPDRMKLPVILILTIALIIVVAFKGERPVKWRWGRRNGQ